MAVEQRPGFAAAPRPSRPDIRIVRLGVSIAKCLFLESYFLDARLISMACDYCDVQDTPIIQGPWNYTNITRESVTAFLHRAHSKDPTKFAEFLTYVLNDIVRIRGTLDEWPPEIADTFSDFEKDLKALGYVLKDRRVLPAIGSGTKEEAAMIGELERMLHGADPELLEMHQGAWGTLLSGGADSDRQAIGSARELLNHTIDVLAGKEGSRKQKVERIIGGQDAETVEAVAELVKSLHELESKGLKAEPSFERARYVLKLTEYTLYYLLKSVQEGSPHM